MKSFPTAFSTILNIELSFYLTGFHSCVESAVILFNPLLEPARKKNVSYLPKGYLCEIGDKGNIRKVMPPSLPTTEIAEQSVLSSLRWQAVFKKDNTEFETGCNMIGQIHVKIKFAAENTIA